MNDTTQQAYRVLARKYRPETFSELIGQDALVRTLSNALTLGRLAHAFVLTGVRGIDKTSTARLLAKGFLVEAPTWAPNGRVLKYFKQNPTAEDGTGGETYLYRVDITGFNEQRVVTPSFASDPAWSPLLQ